MIDRSTFSFKLKYQSDRKTQSLSFPQGLNVIYGESGVGKSELIKCLSNNSDSRFNRFKVFDISLENDIQIIQQNPDLQIIGNTIANELALNLEFHSSDSIQIQKDLQKIIQALPLNVDLRRHPSTLSGGEKEILNIYTSISIDPIVILLDDALSFLSTEMKDIVINQLAELKNTTILWFTSDYHDLDYAVQKWEMTTDNISKTQSKLKSEMLIHNNQIGNYNLEISGLNFSYNEIESVFNDLNVKSDNFRCLGILGDNGTGKSTLASLLLKIEKPNSGSMKLYSNEISETEIGYLDQFPEKILGIYTVHEFINKLINNDKLDPSNLEKIKTELLDSDLDWSIIKDKTALELSWTEIRFILICILSNCIYDLLILDEPTFGLGNQQTLNLQSYFVRYLKKKHLILISHDKTFINSLCDSIINL